MNQAKSEADVSIDESWAQMQSTDFYKNVFTNWEVSQTWNQLIWLQITFNFLRLLLTDDILRVVMK